ncbi:MAG TPA: HAD family hydrolase [Stellaceae bacterium]|nr:HAD family hydrolase [Stellaceae bacterium]
MVRAILLDLDDTLYDEAAYMRSGFAAVAVGIAGMTGYAPAAVLEVLLDVERREGRGRVFDTALTAFGMTAGSDVVQDLVTVYRSHRPRIELHAGARELLARLRRRGRTAIVTDGLPLIQRRKIAALGLESAVDAVVYTWDLGAPKPDPAGYLDALARLGATPAEAVVVGDNPRHDLVAARAIGARAIRVLRGRFGSVPAPAGAEPDLEIADIGALEPALDELEVPASANAGYAEGVAAHA